MEAKMSKVIHVVVLLGSNWASQGDTGTGSDGPVPTPVMLKFAISG